MENFKKPLVTGGGGFLGKALCKRLTQRGCEVRNLSRGSYPDLQQLGIDQHQGSIADYDAVRKAVEGRDIVFHVAGKVGIWGDPEEFWQTNVVGTENIIRACKDAGVKHLVHTSSPSVVFDGTDLEGIDESYPIPQHFEAAYPLTKAEAEKRVKAANSAELATVSLRPHLIWGPEDTNLVPRIIARAKAGRLRKIGSGEKLVDIVYIDNCVDAHILAAEKLEPGSIVAGKAYFISNDQPLPLWEVVRRILDAAGLPPVQRSIPSGLAYAIGWAMEQVYLFLNLPGEPMMTRFLAGEMSTAHWFNISAAKQDLGYTPNVSIDEGMQRLKTWLREQK